MAGVYFFSINEIPDENIENENSSFVNLINRGENEVTEIVFYTNGERASLTPYIDHWGLIQWEYSGAGDYTLLPHLIKDKARSAWFITAVDTAHENAAHVELTAFGLEPPALILEANFRDGTQHTLYLGSTTADFRHYFIMVDDDPAIYLINAILGERMLYGAAEMLDLSIPFMPVERAYFIQITQRDTAPIVLSLRNENDPVSPLDGLVDAVGGEQLIMREPLAGMFLSHSRLIEHVISPMSQVRFRELVALHPDDLAPFGLENPSLEFILRTPEHDFHFIFGDTFSRGGEEFIYVRCGNRPHVFITENEFPAALTDLPPLEIANRFLASVSLADVESVTISREASVQIEMNRIPNTFEIEPTMNGIPIEADDARTAFRLIISLLADADVEPFTPQGEPELTITHHRVENPDTQLRFFDYNANFFAVSINGGDVIFVTNRRAIDRLFQFLGGLV
jgi:hypothetical protein